MSRITDKQLVQLIERRNLEPTDYGFISRELFQAFLDGVTISVVGSRGGIRVFDLKDPLEKMVEAGFHRITDEGVGMQLGQYRRLWPKVIVQPPEYNGLFDRVLLVDRTIPSRRLLAHGEMREGVRPEDCQDFMPTPRGADGQPLKRYVAFFRVEGGGRVQSVTAVRTSVPRDDGRVWLVTHEGLHLPFEHQELLRDTGVDLPGSTHGGRRTPFICLFAADRPTLDSRLDDEPNIHFASASRGSKVIPVS